MKITAELDDNNYIIQSEIGYFSEFQLRKGQSEAICKIDDNFMENFLFVAPTAYGKTITAIHYIIKMYNNKLKVIYTAPLKALTAEVVEKLGNMGFNVLEDTGDYRKNPQQDYHKCDVLITTYERLDAVIRNPRNHEVFDEFGLLIVDEVHSVHSKSRGVNLESLITKVKYHTSMAVMGMSATCDNYKTIAEFLDAKYTYVPPEERPIKQKIEVMYYPDGYHSQTMTYRNSQIRPIINSLIKRDKQALIFCSSRKRCEKLAQEFSGIRTRDPIELAKRSNYSFHHAGVSTYNKKEIEGLFLSNKIKFIFCTPTLAMGVNLPAYCVIIYDTCRWNGLISDNERIENIEIEQMIGRAGRPQFGEKICEVYILSRQQDNPYEFHDNHIESKMEKELKSVFNEWVCSGINQTEEIKDCLEETLLKIQIDPTDLKQSGGEALKYLINNGFINKVEGQYEPSFLGKMTALFYIRPETALHYKKIESMYSKKEYSDVELTAMLLNTEEFLEMIRVEERDAQLIDLCDTCFFDNKVDVKLYEDRIMKAIPMIFVDHFNKTYNCNIFMYRNDAIQLAQIMERLLASAGVIIYDKTLTKRIEDLKVMIKNKTLDRNVAILRSVKGLGEMRLNRLFGAGIKKPEDFLRRSTASLMKIMKVSENVLKGIKENLVETLKNR